MTTLVLNAMAQVPAQQCPPSGGAFGGFMPLILIFVIFYFFLIRPQQKKMKEHQKTLAALKRGDRIITAGGIHGKVSRIDAGLVEVEVADGVNIAFSKTSISAVIPEGKQTVEGAATIGKE